MNKKLVIIGIVVLLVGALLFWLFAAPSVAAAVLYIDEGTVEVDQGKGWVPGSDEMELGPGAKVRTSTGSASVIILEGEVVHLEPNTEISLDDVSKDSIRIKQTAGETWSKITKISGISTFEVETPNTVATVRGTELFVTVGDDEDDVEVGDGEVEVGFAKKPGEKHKVSAMHKMRMQHKLDKMTEEVVSDDARITKFREKYVKHLQRMRMREIKKHGVLMGAAKTRYGIADDQVQRYLDDVDAGKQDEDKAFAQVPGMLKKNAERTYKITKEIKKAKQKMRQP